MKGFFIKLLIGVVALITIIILVNHYFPYSEGTRAGELVKFSKKGVMFKTYEGELSQGVSEAQRFFFSVEEKHEDVIEKLNNVQGSNVKLTYEERYFTFPWIGDTKYYIVEVEDRKGLPATDEMIETE